MKNVEFNCIDTNVFLTAFGINTSKNYKQKFQFTYFIGVDIFLCFFIF